jgi:ergothioneine biosynthesis protein EgtB
MDTTPLALPLDPTGLRLRRDTLTARFQRVRSQTGALTTRLSPEDMQIAAGPDGSPAKWHLAHTTWVFEALVAGRFVPGYRPFDPQFAMLFGGPFVEGGPVLPPDRRDILSRPSVAEIMQYRDHVNATVLRLVGQLAGEEFVAAERLVTFGIEHEQRHQEWMLTDLKRAFWENPTLPAYRTVVPRLAEPQAITGWIAVEGGATTLGAADDGPCLDDETPRHAVHVEPFRIADRPVACGDYLDFMEDGGYEDPRHWLSDGWQVRRTEGWRAPQYWLKRGGRWHVFTLGGLRALDRAEPVCHVSWYEADAFARWSGARLPGEAEWETVAIRCAPVGNLRDGDALHPRAGPAAIDGPCQLFGDVWEWTRSAHLPYPRHRPGPGPLAARFMGNRMVARGGSCLTAPEQARATSRLPLPPATRWQMTGIRLATDG